MPSILAEIAQYCPNAPSIVPDFSEIEFWDAPGTNAAESGLGTRRTRIGVIDLQRQPARSLPMTQVVQTFNDVLRHGFHDGRATALRTDQSDFNIGQAWRKTISFTQDAHSRTERAFSEHRNGQTRTGLRLKLLSQTRM